MERSGPIKLSWAHALFVLATMYNFLAVPQLDAVLLHVLLNGWGWGALYETTDDFVPTGTPPAGSSPTAVSPSSGGCLVPECTGLKTTPYAPTAVGAVLAALSMAMATASSATQVRRWPHVTARGWGFWQ